MKSIESLTLCVARDFDGSLWLFNGTPDFVAGAKRYFPGYGISCIKIDDMLFPTLNWRDGPQYLVFAGTQP